MKKQLALLLIFIFVVKISSQNSFLLDSLEKTIEYNADKAIVYGDSILQYVTLSEFEKSKVKYYQGLAFQRNKNHKKALQYFNEILSVIEDSHDKEIYISTLLSQSNSNVYLNNYTAATKQALKARSIAQKNKISDLVASSNTALSFIYYSSDDYLKALEYLVDSEHIFIKEKKDEELSALYNNMAILYKKMNHIDKAIQYNEKSLQISIKDHDYYGIAKSYSNIGRIFSSQANYSKAIENYKKALQINEENNISNSIPFSNIAEALVLIKKYDEAEQYLAQALQIELKNENEYKIKNIYTTLLEIAINTKSYKNAYDYQQKLVEIEKRIARYSNEEKIKMIENQYKLSQKQQELVNTKRKNRNQLILFVSLTMLFIFFVLFFVQRNRTIKLTNEREKMILEQRVLRSQMNPHFIFNALSAIQNTLLDNDPIKSAQFLSKFAKLIRQNFDFINKKNILLVDEIDALKNYLETQKIRFQNKFDYEINIFADVDIHSVDIPPLLLQPFIENAIEHGFKNKKEKGKITINISRTKDSYCYEIIDNGKGFSNYKSKNKLHAIDIFKKRLKLRDKNDEKSFKIIATEEGTRVIFCLKI